MIVLSFFGAWVCPIALRPNSAAARGGQREESSDGTAPGPPTKTAPGGRWDEPAEENSLKTTRREAAGHGRPERFTQKEKGSARRRGPQGQGKRPVGPTAERSELISAAGSLVSFCKP
jgi:hypothetical protein